MNSGEWNTLILDFVMRYGLITVEAANVLFPDLRPNAIVKRLARLVEEERLEKWRYIPPRSCWLLWKRPGAYTFPHYGAIVSYCLFGENRRELVEYRGPADICVSGGKREAVLIDYGTKSPDHTARKVARFCRDHHTADLSEIVVLVPTEPKADRTQRAVNKHELT